MPHSSASEPGGNAAGSGPRPSEPGFDSFATPTPRQILFRRYHVVRELGRGGMGVVLLVHDTSLDVPVAVKMVPNLVVQDTEGIAELRKEVLRGMALTHPSIVRTHNFERDDTGAAIVMEYVDGPTLAELKQRQSDGCFDPDQILPWVEQLCDVLDYAHLKAQIVHRDLKPRNLMMTRDGYVKVADFGIAAALTDSASRHSMEGKVSGTLSYMSPQQIEGKRPTSQDDIHALGATLYELLTGKPPFFRGNQGAISHQVVSVVPPSIAERRAEFGIQGRLPVPHAWEEVIAACLAKDPGKRPANCAELLQALRQPATSRFAPPAVATPAPSPPPPAPPPSIPPHFPPIGGFQTSVSLPPQKRSIAPWVTLGILLILGAATLGWFAFQPRSGKSASVQPTPAAVATLPATPPPLAIVSPTPPPLPAEPSTKIEDDAPRPVENERPSIPALATPSPATPIPTTPVPATPSPEPELPLRPGSVLSGAFLYGASYAAPYRGKSVRFQLVIDSINEKTGAFRGNTSEPYSGFGTTGSDGRLHANVTGRIRKTSSGGFSLSFTKTYRYFAQDSVNYEGTANSAGQNYSGRWAFQDDSRLSGSFNLSLP